MFGLKKEASADKFAFDLEKEIREKPARGKEILEKVDKRIHETKKLLREGQNQKEYDNLGALLHGYASLQKVIRKIIAK